MAAGQPRNAALELLGRWRLYVDGSAVPFPGRDQRVIAAVALLETRPRRQLAELLWPDRSRDNARGNLRVNVWDIRKRSPGVFGPGNDPLVLDSTLTVDVFTLQSLPRNIQSCDSVSQLWDLLESARHAELLPGWFEPWLDFEQERVRLLRLWALEALSRRFLELGDADGALVAAATAVAAEPWRETSYELLMRAHVLAGNRALALRVYEDARMMLLRELHVEPAPMLASLAAELRHDSQVASDGG